MTDKQIKYFLEICRNMSYSKAAEALYVTQPSITYQIQNLENELGMVLFNRINNSIELTKDGEYFKNKALELEKTYNEIRNYANQTKVKKNRLIISVASIMTDFDTEFLYKTIIDMKNNFSVEEINIVTNKSLEENLNKLMNHEIDILISNINYTVTKNKKIRVLNKFKVKSQVLMKADDELAAKDIVLLSDLRNRIIYASIDENCFFPIIKGDLADENISISYCDNINIAKTHVLMDGGVCLVTNYQPSERIAIRELAIKEDIYTGVLILEDADKLTKNVAEYFSKEVFKHNV